MNNVIQDGNKLLIVNGGNPINDCPRSYEESDIIAKGLNERSIVKGVEWKFDCGFKLDIDGPLISVNGRFYPPKTHYGDKWDGHCSIMLMEEELIFKAFETDTLEELEKQVNQFIKTYSQKIYDRLEDIE